MENVKEAKLEPLLVGDIAGSFIVPSFQRGFRWTEDNILKLLNDIWDNGNQNYCLQPIVVKKLPDGNYELIDGQQRLTTILLILKYMEKLLPYIIKLKFTIKYSTRDRCEEFLSTIDSNLAKDNIDFFHIHNAFQTITNWFEDVETDKGLKAINLYKYFGEKVKVIWYEVNNHEDSTNLFTRLNIGKIPLTNAELVKALFLSKDNNEISEEKQIEISTEWDNIEKGLHNPNFWAFLTNEPATKYTTRIELLFNLIADKKPEEREKFFTFYYFSERIRQKNKKKIWEEIQNYFLLLKEWFENRNLYHKVGYLVTTGERLQDLVKESKGKTKSIFESELDIKIKKCLDLEKENILELSYEKKQDRSKIEKLLLLFNVETVRLLKNSSEKYSFESHKSNAWSLEHIHAQLSEGLSKKEEQQEWLVLHRASLSDLIQSNNTELNIKEINELIGRIDVNYENITRTIFDVIFSDVIRVLSNDENKDYLHQVSNMALLKVSTNSAINNSTFDVKRNKILEMDKAGEYIPICTRRVFLKYYTKSVDHQLHFWGESDRKAYVEAMIGEDGLLVKYLK